MRLLHKMNENHRKIHCIPDITFPPIAEKKLVRSHDRRCRERAEDAHPNRVNEPRNEEALP